MLKALELIPQAPQATTDLHRIALGLEAGSSDQCVFSLCCFDSCIIEGIVNPVRDEGLWNRCESSLLILLQSHSSGPVLLHTLSTLSLSLQVSDPESDSLVPRLIDILLGDRVFSLKERHLSLRCLSILELDENELKSFRNALTLILRFCNSDDGLDLLSSATALISRFVADLTVVEVNQQIVPALLRHMKASSKKSLYKLSVSCVGLIHMILESRPELISECRTSVISSLVDRLNGGCGCSACASCEICQGCVSCLLRLGVHPVMREDLRPFIDAILQIAWNWTSGSPVAAQSLLNMMSGLLH
jgi:hypothetical protein